MWLEAQSQLRKELDETYLGILAIACSDNLIKPQGKERNDLIKLLNRIPSYGTSIWRLIPVLSERAQILGVYKYLDPKTQAYLNIETKKGILRELAKKQLLNQIVECLTSLGIPLILLKSTAYADVLYTSNAPRLAGDIDILIKVENLELAQEGLSRFLVKVPSNQGVFDGLIEVSFIPKTGNSIPLDLHTSLSYPYITSIDMDDVWLTSQEHRKYNNPLVRSLSLEYEIIHQSIHCFVDLDYLRYSLVDLSKLLQAKQVSFDKLIRIAGSAKCENLICYLAFNYEVVHTNVITRKLANLGASWKMNKLGHALINSPRSTRKNIKTFQYRVFQVLSHYALTGNYTGALKLHLLYLYKACVNRVFKSNNK